MLIACPKCTTNYELDASTLGAKGRSVRCVRCKGVWFAESPGAARATAEPPLPEVASDDTVAAFKAELSEPPAVPDDLVIEDSPATADAAPPAEPAPPPAEEPASLAPAGDEEKAGPSLDELMGSSPAQTASEAPASDSEPAAAEATPAAGTEAPPALALSEITIPVEQPPAAPAVLRGSSLPLEALKLDGAAENIEIAAARRSAPKSKRKRGSRSPAQLPALIIALLAIVATLFAMRNPIVRHAPQMASFYESLGVTVNLRGLEFAGVKLTRDTHDGVPVLVIEGSIVNATKNPVEVPRLRFALRNEAGSEVYSWTALPAQTAVLPGEPLPFRSRLASPPTEARDVQVRFFTRRDAVAGLR